jgi:hypothetical protein
MPIFEADFHPHSYGFRPKRNAHRALDTIVEALRSGRTEVLDADLSKYSTRYRTGRCSAPPPGASAMAACCGCSSNG